MDEKRISVVVLLEMTKAFDSIRHDILLAKLRRIGISSSALAWLSHRRTGTFGLGGWGGGGDFLA